MGFHKITGPDQAGDLLGRNAGVTRSTGFEVCLEPRQPRLNSSDLSFNVRQRRLGDLVRLIGNPLHKITIASEADREHGPRPAFNDFSHGQRPGDLNGNTVVQDFPGGDCLDTTEIKRVHLYDAVGDDLDPKPIKVIESRSTRHLIILGQALLRLNVRQYRCRVPLDLDFIQGEKGENGDLHPTDLKGGLVTTNLR